jgi:magnesium and cobalt transporter
MQIKNKWLAKILGLLKDSPKTKIDLLEVLKDTVHNGVLDNESLKMIEGVFKVSEVQVRDIMIPRPHMIVIDIADQIDEIVKKVATSGHSRFPVIDDNRDEIIGVLLAKDLLKKSIKDDNDDINLHELLRPAVFVPESKRLNILLNEFKSSRNHIAIVVDEYGGVSGMVTIEDVLEQIVGDIEDEFDYDETEDNIIQDQERQFRVKASTEISDFNDYFATEYSDEEFTTIGGLVTQKFGYLPQRNEKTMIWPYSITFIILLVLGLTIILTCL